MLRRRPKTGEEEEEKKGGEEEGKRKGKKEEAGRRGDRAPPLPRAVLSSPSLSLPSHYV